MNKEYRLIYEEYANQQAMANIQQNGPYERNRVKTRTDGRNSTALRTCDLPAAGGGKSGPVSGSIGMESNEEEMVNVKGVGQIKRKDAEKAVLKIVDELLNLSQRGQFKSIPAKVDTLKALTDVLVK